MQKSESKTRILIDWCNLSLYSDKFLLDTFDQLLSQLTQNYPDLPLPEFRRLPSDLVPKLPNYLLSLMPGNSADKPDAEFELRHVFVFCDTSFDFVNAYQKHNELAHSGIAIPGTFALAWLPNKYLIWHELLHLFNAKDCYNKFGINKCQDPKCIMRRGLSREDCGDRLTLCSKNVKRIYEYGLRYAIQAELDTQLP